MGWAKPITAQNISNVFYKLAQFGAGLHLNICNHEHLRRDFQTVYFQQLIILLDQQIADLCPLGCKIQYVDIAGNNNIRKE